MINSNSYIINSRDELIEYLNKYKGILKDSILDYLNSVLNLEFSVLKDYITNADRMALSELEVYKKIAIYNIYNRTLNILKHLAFTYTNSSNRLTLYSPIGEKMIKVFEFDYSYYLPNLAGKISLYQTLENEELREAELLRVMEELEKLYDQKNPYHSLRRVYGGPASTWFFEHKKQIKEYEELFKQLDGKTKLTDIEKREIEITNLVYNLILKDFGLTSESFTEKLVLISSNLPKLERKLVKEIPPIKIESNIKYI